MRCGQCCPYILHWQAIAEAHGQTQPAGAACHCITMPCQGACQLGAQKPTQQHCSKPAWPVAMLLGNTVRCSR